MAKTLLNAINEILKRVSVIAGDSSVMTSLTDSARQPAIDIAVQVINEAIDRLYYSTNLAMPTGQGEDTITLLLGVRSYPLAADLVRLRYPFIDRVNTQHLFEFAGGYNQMLVFDPEQDDDGLPHFGAISPVNGEFHVDRAPKSDSVGRVYFYQYDKDISLEFATDLFPFTDAVFRALLPAWVQLWKRERRNQFDEVLFTAGLGLAGRLLTKKTIKSSWSPRGRRGQRGQSGRPFHRSDHAG